MDSVSLLRAQLENAHQTLEGTLGDIGQEDAHREPGGRAFSVAALYAHVVFAEDMLVNGMFRQATPLHASRWAGRTGFSEVMPAPSAEVHGGWAEAHDRWARGLRADLAQARQYAQAVQADALAYVSSLTPEELGRPVELTFLPATPLGLAITIFVVGHYYALAGEMSAVKGVIGLKGYPF
jgi:hypothetical protein